MRWEIVISEELAQKVRRVMKPALYSSISELVRAAIREYVQKLELEYAEELRQ